MNETTSVTGYFYHQDADRHFPDTLGPQPVEYPFTVSDELIVGPSGKVFAYSHSFWDVKTYDFWLQIFGADQWGDLVETHPWTQYDPSKQPHWGAAAGALGMTGRLTAPHSATFPVNFQLDGLVPGVRVRAITTHLEGRTNRSHSGAWGVSIVTDAWGLDHDHE